MWGIKYKPIRNIAKSVENDVREFVEHELIIYRQNPENKRLDNSVIVNIAMFDLHFLKLENGVTQMINLVSDHNNQVVGRRLKHLLHMLYIKYGLDEVDDLAEKTLRSMQVVYDIPEKTISFLDFKINVFWLQPFINAAYSSLMFEVEQSIKQ